MKTWRWNNTQGTQLGSAPYYSLTPGKAARVSVNCIRTRKSSNLIYVHIPLYIYIYIYIHCNPYVCMMSDRARCIPSCWISTEEDPRSKHYYWKRTALVRLFSIKFNVYIYTPQHRNVKTVFCFCSSIFFFFVYIVYKRLVFLPPFSFFWFSILFLYYIYIYNTCLLVLPFCVRIIYIYSSKNKTGIHKRL